MPPLCGCVAENLKGQMRRVEIGDVHHQAINGSGKQQNVQPQVGELGSQHLLRERCLIRRKKAVVRVQMSSESTLTHDRLAERATGYSVTPHTMA
jgi:hypothetical protein